MSESHQKMNVFQLTVITLVNMMGSGIILLPSKLAEIGTITIFSWLFTAGGSIALAYVFARCGMLSKKPGGMGGYAAGEALCRAADGRPAGCIPNPGCARAPGGVWKTGSASAHRGASPGADRDPHAGRHDARPSQVRGGRGLHSPQRRRCLPQNGVGGGGFLALLC